MKTPPLVVGMTVLLAIESNALTVYTIDQITVKDSGGTAHLNSSPPTPTINLAKDGTDLIDNISGDLNLQSFEINNTLYNANQFISGVGPSALITKDLLTSVLQPGAYTGTGFYTGTTNPVDGSLDNAAPYLTSGERGLSFSSALNYRATVDDSQTISVPLQFLSNPSATNRPTFFAGDGAVGQQDDLWEFYAGSTLVASFSIDGDDDNDNDWSTLGKQHVDRYYTDGITSSDQDLNLDISMIAFSLDASDFVSGQDPNLAWQTIDTLRITMPGDGSNDPKTDYSFIGIDLDVVDSPNSVVPEPHSAQLLLTSLLSICLYRKRKAEIN